ncbi:MAG: hypothetical protein WCO00_12825, partial [Rhodospirillaceae bacterium]
LACSFLHDNVVSEHRLRLTAFAASPGRPRGRPPKNKSSRSENPADHQTLLPGEFSVANSERISITSTINGNRNAAAQIRRKQYVSQSCQNKYIYIGYLE